MSLSKLYSIRLATPDDAAQILDIYTHYVKNTAITFECAVPTLDEFTTRIEKTLKQYPYLVCEEDDKIIGYAYASAFHSREAYAHSVEVTVYVAPQMRRDGMGRQLYEFLESILEKQNVYNLYACIAYPPKTENIPEGFPVIMRSEDQYLNFDSVQFHERMGYRMIGEFEKCGYKFETWYSMVWMEKQIGSRPKHPQAFLPYPELIK